jgi:hypothetical protein
MISYTEADDLWGQVTLPPELLNDKGRKVFAGWYPDSKKFLITQVEPEGPEALRKAGLSDEANPENYLAGSSETRYQMRGHSAMSFPVQRRKRSSVSATMDMVRRRALRQHD